MFRHTSSSGEQWQNQEEEQNLPIRYQQPLPLPGQEDRAHPAFQPSYNPVGVYDGNMTWQEPISGTGNGPSSFGGEYPPPLPPKPSGPVDYTRVTQGVSGLRLNRNRPPVPSGYGGNGIAGYGNSRSPYGTAGNVNVPSISEFTDRRPNLHPSGPRSPRNTSPGRTSTYGDLTAPGPHNRPLYSSPTTGTSSEHSMTTMSPQGADGYFNGGHRNGTTGLRAPPLPPPPLPPPPGVGYGGNAHPVDLAYTGPYEHMNSPQPQFNPDSYDQHSWNDVPPVQVPRLSPVAYDQARQYASSDNNIGGEVRDAAYSDNYSEDDEEYDEDNHSFMSGLREELNSGYQPHSPSLGSPTPQQNPPPSLPRVNIPAVSSNPNPYQNDPYHSSNASPSKNEKSGYEDESEYYDNPYQPQNIRPTGIVPKRHSLPNHSNLLYKENRQDRRQSNIINMSKDSHQFHPTLSAVSSSSYGGGNDMTRSSSDVSRINITDAQQLHSQTPPILSHDHQPRPFYAPPPPDFTRSHTTSSDRRPVSGLIPPPDLDSSLRSSTRSTDEELMIKLGLPSIPDSVPVFDASRLSSRDFERCKEIWSLHSVSQWISSLFRDDLEVSIGEITRALIGLFTHYIPTLNWLQAELVAEDYVKTLRSSSFILLDKAGQSREDNLPSTPTISKAKVTSPLVKVEKNMVVSGVFPILTGSGCYSKYAHKISREQIQPYRCYSSKCSRTLPVKAALPKIDIAKVDSANNKDWATCYKIDKAQQEEIGKREVRRQSAIHEIIVGEESFVSDLNILLSVYGDSLSHKSNIMTNQNEFCQNAFGLVKEVVDYNTQYLLRGLKYRQSQESPFISGIADIVLEWIKNANDPYSRYVNSYPHVDRRLRKERETNSLFAIWLETASKDPRTKGFPHAFYFQRVIPRFLRYAILLSAIKDHTLTSSPEYPLLERCVEECKRLGHGYNVRLGEIQKSIDLLDLSDQIGRDLSVQLRLNDAKRRIIARGDVLRKGGHSLDWITTHLILLDNFLILAKRKPGTTGLVVSKKVSIVDYLL